MRLHAPRPSSRRPLTPGQPRRSVAASRFAAVAVAVAGLALGPACVREVAKEATKGTLEALQRPRQPGGTGAPGQTTPQPPAQQKVIGGIVRDAVRAGTAALASEMTRVQPFVAQTSEAAGSGLVLGALRHDRDLLGLVEQGSGVAGRAFTREAVAEILQELAAHAGRDADEGGLAASAALLAQQAAAGAMRGATEQLASTLSACPTGDASCAYALIEQASFAAGRGASAGIQQQFAPWPLVLAFALGVLLAAPAGLIVGTLVSRRAVRPGS